MTVDETVLPETKHYLQQCGGHCGVACAGCQQLLVLRVDVVSQPDGDVAWLLAGWQDWLASIGGGAALHQQ